LRELHGVFQIAMGWEGIHLYQFSLRATRYGSSELAASSSNVTLAALRLRRGGERNDPWCGLATARMACFALSLARPGYHRSKSGRSESSRGRVSVCSSKVRTGRS
jgi:hypothetical protein